MNRKYKLSVDEAELIEEVLISGAWAAVIKVFEQELADMLTPLLNVNLDGQSETKELLALRKAEYQGAALLLSRVKALKDGQKKLTLKQK